MHLGARNSNASVLLEFLRDPDFETLYIVGDLIDLWQMRGGILLAAAIQQRHPKIPAQITQRHPDRLHPRKHDEFQAESAGSPIFARNAAPGSVNRDETYVSHDLLTGWAEREFHERFREARGFAVGVIKRWPRVGP